MSRSNRAKESCDCSLLISLCGCFDDISANFEYLPLGGHQSHSTLATDWKNASVVIGVVLVSAQIISLGTYALLLIMWANIVIENLSNYFLLFALLRLDPQVSNT